MSQLEKENNKSIAKENSDIFSKGYFTEKFKKEGIKNAFQIYEKQRHRL